MSDSYIGFKRLSSPIHFHTAVLEQTPKLVLKPLFGSGKIEEIHEETLKIRDEWFMRRTCTAGLYGGLVVCICEVVARSRRFFHDYSRDKKRPPTSTQ